MARTPYRWFSVNRIGPGELMGRVAKLKLQYFGHITRGSAGQLALTVLEGIMEGLWHQGRPRRQWIHHTWHWRVDWLRIHSAKGDVTRSSTMENKDIGVVICCRQPSSRKVDQWVREWDEILPKIITFKQYYARKQNLFTAARELRDSCDVPYPSAQWVSSAVCFAIIA